MRLPRQVARRRAEETRRHTTPYVGQHGAALGAGAALSLLLTGAGLVARRRNQALTAARAAACFRSKRFVLAGAIACTLNAVGHSWVALSLR